MTTASPGLRLGACARCEGDLALSYDMFPSGYWRCLQCGDHDYVNVPVEARVRLAEARRAYYSVFDYRGKNDNFTGVRIRGQLLPPKPNEVIERFALSCPFDCPRLMYCTGNDKHRKIGKGWHTYVCKNRHRLILNVKMQQWD